MHFIIMYTLPCTLHSFGPFTFAYKITHIKHFILNFLNSSSIFCTCVNSVIEIPLSLQCKTVQYKFLWQYLMKFQEFFSLCQVQQPAWLQLDHKKLGPSEMRFFRTLCHKTEKHARVCDIMLWKTLIRVSMNFYIYQEWVKIYLIIYQFLKPII